MILVRPDPCLIEQNSLRNPRMFSVNHGFAKIRTTKFHTRALNVEDFDEADYNERKRFLPKEMIKKFIEEK